MIISFSKLGGGGGGYVLPTATANRLGGIKVGSGLSVDSGGTLSAEGGAGGGGDYIVTEALSSITNPTEGMYAFVPAHMEGNTSTAVTYTVDGDFYDGLLGFSFDLTDTGVPIDYRHIDTSIPYRFENGAGKIEPYFMNDNINNAIGPLTGSEWRGINGNGWGKVKLIESGLTVIFDDNVSFSNGLPDFEGLIKTVETGATTYVPDTLWFYAEGGWHRATLTITLNSREEIKSEFMWISQHTDYLDRIKLTFGNFEFDGDKIENDYDGNKWLDHFVTYGDGFKITYFWHPELRYFILQSGNIVDIPPVAQCKKFNVDVDSAGTETLYTNGISPEQVYAFARELAGYERTDSKPLYLIAGDVNESWYTDSIDEMKIYRNHAQAVAAREQVIPGALEKAVTVEGRFFNYVTEKWRKITIASVYQNDTWEWGTPTIVDE